MREMSNLGRRAFIAMGAAAAAGLSRGQSAVVKSRMKQGDPDSLMGIVKPSDEELEAAIKTLECTTMQDDEKRLPALHVVQRAIDRMSEDLSFKNAIRETAHAKKVAAALAKFPVMRWYDRAFDRVLEQLKSTKVEAGKPAIWYIYNMGLVVKTATCTFGIDICHRKAHAFAEHLDFLLTTHNHGDHFNNRLMRLMSAEKKPVLSNFMLIRNWYCRDMEKTFKIKDITIHCTAADHNAYLPWAVTNYEVVCGDGAGAFSIFHSGDCNRADHLRPHGKPDFYFGHCAIGLDFMAAAQGPMPAKTFIPLHHQELGHLGGQWRCVGFEDEPLRIVRSLRSAGFKAALPLWGDRII